MQDFEFVNWKIGGFVLLMSRTVRKVDGGWQAIPSITTFLDEQVIEYETEITYISIIRQNATCNFCYIYLLPLCCFLTSFDKSNFPLRLPRLLSKQRPDGVACSLSKNFSLSNHHFDTLLTLSFKPDWQDWILFTFEFAQLILWLKVAPPGV